MKKDFQKLKIVWIRRYHKILDKDYVKKKLAKRTGKCKRCGACCRGCIFLNKKTKLCRIYSHRFGIFCYRDFPLDKNDQKVWNVEKFCGYKFKK